VPRLLTKEQSRIVFYRLDTDANKAVASVYIDNGYQGSLQPGGFTQVCLPPRTIEVRAIKVLILMRNTNMAPTFW
jgi:hypothetical protein